MERTIGIMIELCVILLIACILVAIIGGSLVGWHNVWLYVTGSL